MLEKVSKSTKETNSLKKNFLKDIPHSQGFLSYENLHKNSMELLKNRKVDCDGVAYSKEGREISAIKIGEGQKTVFLIGFPHPDEPIGGTALDYFAKELIKKNCLFKYLDYTFIIINCIDPDGAVINEKWFKNKFDFKKHITHYYRPPLKKQVEWTFPVSYKQYSFNKPLKETKFLIRLIKKHKPTAVFPLHNSVFGGVFFYTNKESPALYPRLRAIVNNENFPLHFGGSEDSAVKQIDECIFELGSLKTKYDYYKKNYKKAYQLLDYGTSCGDYLKSQANGFCLIPEIPLFFDKRVNDRTPTKTPWLKTALASAKKEKTNYAFALSLWKKINGTVNPNLRQYEFLSNHFQKFEIKETAFEKYAKMTKIKRNTTKAEKFNMLVIPEYDSLLLLGNMYSLLRDCNSNKPIERLLENKINTNLHNLKDKSDIIIPLPKQLITVQLSCILETLLFLRDKECTY